MHANDRLAALEYALELAALVEHPGPLHSLHMQALRELRDEAMREARG